VFPDCAPLLRAEGDSYVDDAPGFREAVSHRIGGCAGDSAEAGVGACGDEGNCEPAARAGRDDRLEPRAAWRHHQAREIGLDGIQVSVQYPTDGKTPTLRDPKTQAAFKRAALENGIQICSLAIGNPGKSRMPMHTSPAFSILLTEAVEIAHNLGTNNILLPILGDSHIDMTSQAQVDTFVAMMKEVARYAEKYEVVVGLEDWISAEDNIKLLDAIGSDYVAVYYDAHNIVPRVKDIYAEPKMLGKRIHQIHVKNANMLMSGQGGRLDWPRMAKEFYEIGYRGWYVLETASPTNDIVADTRANIEYVKKTFRMPPPPIS
jgi:L-ribulose-5-phosphate 3-epimerase